MKKLMHRRSTCASPACTYRRSSRDRIPQIQSCYEPMKNSSDQISSSQATHTDSSRSTYALNKYLQILNNLEIPKSPSFIFSLSGKKVPQPSKNHPASNTGGRLDLFHFLKQNEPGVAGCKNASKSVIIYITVSAMFPHTHPPTSHQGYALHRIQQIEQRTRRGTFKY